MSDASKPDSSMEIATDSVDSPPGRCRWKFTARFGIALVLCLTTIMWIGSYYFGEIPAIPEEIMEASATYQRVEGHSNRGPYFAQLCE